MKKKDSKVNYVRKGYMRLFGFDGSHVDIPYAKGGYPISMWERGKCWSVFCRNELHFLKLNKKGEAMYGYCFHTEDEILKAEYPSSYNTGKGQMWVYVERGKLKILKRGEVR